MMQREYQKFINSCDDFDILKGEQKSLVRLLENEELPLFRIVEYCEKLRIIRLRLEKLNGKLYT